jgi:hypothetical protein
LEAKAGDVNAWAFGAAVLIVAMIVVGVLLDRAADRGHALRWEERFYQPQLPVRRGRVIDVQTRNTPVSDWGVYDGGATRKADKPRGVVRLGR